MVAWIFSSWISASSRKSGAAMPSPISAEPLRAQRDLRAGFLAADIERGPLARDFGQRLQQQRRFADAGIAADQHHAARDEAAAQHAIEFADAGA